MQLNRTPAVCLLLLFSVIHPERNACAATCQWVNDFVDCFILLLKTEGLWGYNIFNPLCFVVVFFSSFHSALASLRGFPIEELPQQFRDRDGLIKRVTNFPFLLFFFCNFGWTFLLSSQPIACLPHDYHSLTVKKWTRGM